MQNTLANTRADDTVKPIILISLVCIFLSSFEFPGSYTRVFGENLETLIEYSCFLIQIAIMLGTSGKDIQSIKLIDLKVKYISIYLFLAALIGISMLASRGSMTEAVSVIRVSVTALFAIWLCENISYGQLLKTIYYAQILFVAASVLFPVLFSEYDIRSESYAADFVGIGGVKNVVAAELSLGIIMQVLLWRYYAEQERNVSFFFIGFLSAQSILLFMTHGTGALITTIIVVILILKTKENSIRINWGAVLIVTSLLFLIVALTAIPRFAPILTALGKDTTLTGRIPLWNQVIEVMRSTHPFIGYGYGMFWFNDDAVNAMHSGFDKDSFMGNMTSGCHNNLLELWTGIGLLGIIAFFIAVLSAFYGLQRLEYHRYLFVLAYMSYYIIKGWTERSWTTFEYPVLFLFLSMAMACQKETEIIAYSGREFPLI